MYNDTLNVANKIITYDNLNNIFAKMSEKFNYYIKIYEKEEQENERLDYQYQNWTFKNTGSSLEFAIHFSDGNSIRLDNYNDFIGVFNNRLYEIESINAKFYLCYSVQLEGQKMEYYNQKIILWIEEDSMKCDISLSSIDKKIDDVYELIKEIVLKAPPKYNTTISKRSSITNKICFGYGFIPAIVIMTMLIFIEPLRNAFKTSYVLYPLGCIGLGYFIGNLLIVGKVNDLYKVIEPKKVYAGSVNDSYGYRSIYKDDIDKYTQSSEILIGKNVDNLKKRKMIRSMERKYKKYILPELVVIVVISIAIILL